MFTTKNVTLKLFLSAIIQNKIKYVLITFYMYSDSFVVYSPFMLQIIYHIPTKY